MDDKFAERSKKKVQGIFNVFLNFPKFSKSFIETSIYLIHLDMEIRKSHNFHIFLKQHAFTNCFFSSKSSNKIFLIRYDHVVNILHLYRYLEFGHWDLSRLY